MSSPDRNRVSLIGLVSDGAEIGFDGAAIAPGVHLRWSFQSELGFPRHGFKLERRVYQGEIPQPGEWQSLPSDEMALQLAGGIEQLDLLSSIFGYPENGNVDRFGAAATALKFALPRLSGQERSAQLTALISVLLNRLTILTSIYVDEHYKARLRDLISLLRNLEGGGTLAGGDGKQHRPQTRLETIDLLLLASLDPYIARLLGLYYIDGEILPGSPVDYRVTSLWGNASWPEHLISFESVSPHFVSAGHLQIEEAEILLELDATLVKDESSTRLSLSGRGLSARFIFHNLAQVIEFEFTDPLSREDWHIETSDVDNRPVRLASAPEYEDRFIRIRTSTPCQHLSLTLNGANDTVWQLRNIRYRQGIGSIGNEFKSTIRLNPLGDNRNPEPSFYVVPSDSTVGQPQLESLREVILPSGLNEQGRVVAGTTEVEVLCSQPRTDGASPNPGHPVRFHVGYKRTDGAVPHPKDILTTAIPFPWPLPELIAFWPLKGNLRATNRNLAFSIQESSRNQVLFQGINSPYIIRSDGVLLLTGRGYVEAPIPLELNQLGTHLLLQLWVFPTIATQNYSTLIGNNYRQSFWLGLTHRNNRYALRFWLNNKMVESTATIESGKWSHVAVRYDGVKIQFFVNGLSAGVHDAKRGRINVNTRNTICLGADPQEQRSNIELSLDYPFQGYLADVQIWRRTHPSPAIENPNFLVGWSLDGEIRDFQNQVTTNFHGTLRYEVDHPQLSDRQVLTLDGSTFLAVERINSDKLKNQLTFQAWIKPELGQSLPTLVGGRRNSDYWLGLRGDDSAYRLSFQIKGERYESSGTLAAGQWSYITVSLDSKHVSFYINGKLSNTLEVSFVGFDPELSREFCIGADLGSAPGRLLNPFRGKLADLYFWSSVPSAPSPAQIIDKARTRSQQLQTPAFQKRFGELRAAWLLDGGLVDTKTGQYIATSVNQLGFQVGHPRNAKRQVLNLSGRNCIEVREQPSEFYGFGIQLTLRAWVKPEPSELIVNPLDPDERERQTMTLISNDRETSFAWGLRWVTSGYRLWLVLNRRLYETSNVIPAREWSRLQVSYDGEQIVFQARDESSQLIISERYPARLDLIRFNSSRILRIGAEVNSDALDLEHPYRGLLADVEIWNRLPQDLSDLGNPMPEDVSELMLPADYVVHQMPDGTYQFWTQNIDIFGRVSKRSSVRSITLQNRAKPPAPGATQARFIPLSAEIVGITPLPLPEPDSENPILPEVKVEVAITGLDLNGISPDELTRVYNLESDPSLRRALQGGYDAEVLRPRLEAPAYADVESFEIDKITTSGDALTLVVTPFASLSETDRGNQISIAYDYHLAVSWTWTGTQRLFAPDVSRFKLHQKPARQDVDVWPTESASIPDFTVIDDVFEQTETVNHLTVTRVSHDEWQQLQGNDPDQPGIRWLPEPLNSTAPAANKTRVPRADLLRIILPVSETPIEHPHRMPVHEATADTFVPGALVAYNEAEQVQAWLHYQVLWHEWHDRTGWTLYLVQNQPNSQTVSEDSSTPTSPEDLPLPQLRYARYYPGQRYVTDITLSNLPDFGSGSAAVGTVPYHIGVSALANRNGDTLESEISVPASVVAVNRRRPPLPPRPRVAIDRADFYGNSRATVTWDSAGAEVSYQLYRAVDGAVALRDVEQRRLSQTSNPKLQKRNPGYRGMSPAEVFDPNPEEWTFEEWLRAKFNPEQIEDAARRSQFQALLADWQQALFVDKPPELMTGDSPTPEHESWQLASEVWRAWSERFYPALTDAEFSAVAERRGNETAFSLVNSAPIEESPYVDTVNGTVVNRYLYRLRTQTVALVQSAGWGLVSAPERAPKTQPPRAPVFTKIEAGDRSVSLFWSMNREANLSEYVLYRGESLAEIEDLRWWNIEPDPRIVARIADPRIKALNRSIYLPGTLAIHREQDVIGVYRLDEFNFGTENPRTQSQALNYWVTSNSYPLGRSVFTAAPDENGQHELMALRPIADGVALVVVYQDANDREFKALSQYHPPGYEDTDLLGLTDYYYRLLAVNESGNWSEASKISRIRTLELTNPAPPTLEVVRDTTAGSPDEIRLTMAVSQPGMEVLLQWKSPAEQFWRTALNWTAAISETHFYTDTAEPTETKMYRAFARSGSKRASAPSDEVTTIPNNRILADFLS